MKVQNVAVDSIERIGVGVDQAFSINFDAKMARILADGLYSDKVQSVIRELSCNAWDSHVEAGKSNKPFRVHFPTTLEPWFSVQDFGVGLSHQQVMSIYTRYGASTKTNSNDVIGQLGLGSKSPFSLTNAFTVVTRKDGVENHYSMYRNEQGMPCVAQLGQNVTNEPNGVTVQVPVRVEQRREFMDKAREVYKWFPVKPDVAGGVDLGLKKMEFAYSGTSWRIRKVNKDNWGYGESQRPVALMGLVAYPLDSNHIHGLTPEHRCLLNLGLVLDFNIGDLEVAANREALGYDARTIGNITAKLDTVMNELGAQLETKIATAASEFEAHMRFGEIFGHGQTGAYEFREAFQNRGLHWNGKQIKDEMLRYDVTSLYPLTPDRKTTDVIHLCGGNYKRPRRTLFGSDGKHVVRCTDKVRIYFNDVGLGGLSRVHELNKAANYNFDIVIFGATDDVTPDKIKNVLGGVEVLLTSSLPKPPRTTQGKSRTDILQWNGKDGKAKAWTPVEMDISDGGYYVVLDNWDVRAEGFDNPVNLSTYVTAFIDAGLLADDDKIYAMRGKNRATISEDPNWNELFSTMKEQAQDKIRNMALGQYLEDQQAYANLLNECNWAPWDHEFNLQVKISPMREFIEHVREIKTSLGKPSDQIRALQQIASAFNIDLGTKAARYHLLSEWRVITRHYPMLNFVENRYYRNIGDKEVRLVGEYINQVDITDPFIRLSKEQPVD